MIKDYKNIYLNAVESIPEWKKLSQIELAEKYLEKGPNSEAYLSALILKFWSIIERTVYRDRGLFDELEAYDWFINALLYIIKDTPWKDPESSVYKDPKAIEKILNTCISCDRANWFQASNRHKRKANHGIGSLDALKESYSDSFTSEELITEMDVSTYKDLVIYYFKRQQYLMALMIDVIVNDVKLEGIASDKSLIHNIKKSIRSLPEGYAKLFAENYDLDSELVEKSFTYIYNMNDTKLKQSIETYIYKLRAVLESEI